MRQRLSLSGWIGAVMVGVFVVLGVVGPWLAPSSGTVIDLGAQFQPPSSAHWLGTDSAGIDTLSQLLHGARSALVLSSIVVTACALIGVSLGTLAGYFGGAIEEGLMWLVNVLLAFPGILLNIAVVAVVARPDLAVVMGALIVNGWVGYARVARGQALSLRERDYVQASRAVGAGHVRILRRHVVPNLLGPVLVQMTFGFGGVIMVEASLSFLGLGSHDRPTWGAMLDQGTTFLWREGFAYYALLPGLAIMWVVLGANLLGDGLRDRLDPRARGRG
ncbi:MAG: ABC transporter permease [Kofleriaceae bacterium]